VGKAIVANLPHAESAALVKGRALKKKGPKTITSHAALAHDLEKTRARGYALDDEENSRGARCVAAPVFDGLGKVVAAVGVSGTTSQIDRARIRKTAEIVTEAAHEISKQMGYSPTRR
jgi:DNA-binding IclR family transcriptional regulator